jgi:histidinol dehydrogenase
MKKIYNPDKSNWVTLLKRPTQSFEAIEDIVSEVFTKVQNYGDSAIKEYTQKFDNVEQELSVVSSRYS